MEDINADPNRCLNLVLLGKTRAGKSASGNTILGQQAFLAKKSSRSVTQDLVVKSGTVDGFPVTVYDTPGLFNTTLSEEKTQQILEKVLKKCESGLCVFLLVIKADSFTEKENEMVEKIEKLLGENRLDNTWILFTRGDELEEENMTMKEFINETERLKKLVHRYDQRYHVFNNKTKESSGQVKGLLVKVLKPYFDTMGEGTAILNQKPLRKKIPANIEPDTRVSSPASRRIVLLGKTGVGKSAAGNTILGQKEFISLMRTNSVTRKSSMKQATISDRSVSVVDTPGFFDTQMKPEELAMKIAESVYESSPGPHAFFIVLRANDRFTEQEEQIPQMIEMMFGQEVLKYSIILFTHGDQLEGRTIEELIQENSKLRHLVQQCGDRYQVFNNKNLSNRKQVNDLLKKIDTMIQQNGGGHYSNEMLEDAQRCRREEEERRHREEEERKRQEEKQRQEVIERVRKEAEDKTRAEMEDKMKSELEELKRKHDEERRKREEEDRQRKENMKKDGGFMQFFNKHKRYFYVAAVVVGIAVGGVAGGAIAAKYCLCGAAVAAGAVAGAAVGGALGAGAVAGVSALGGGSA